MSDKEIIKVTLKEYHRQKKLVYFANGFFWSEIYSKLVKACDERGVWSKSEKWILWLQFVHGEGVVEKEWKEYLSNPRFLTERKKHCG